jgi:hypothetical protein
MGRQMKTKTGRASKMKKDVIQKLVHAIKTGCTYDLACQYAGIERTTFYNWMKAGREGKTQKHIDFFNTIEEANASGAMTNLQLMQEAAKEDWRSAAWILERRHSFLKNPPVKEDDESIQLPKTTKEIFHQQQIQLMKASKQALKTGSFQAYAALQRQILTVTLQIKSMNLDDEDNDDQSDEQLIQTITDVILSLPPVLQQRLKNDIVQQRNKIVEVED